MAFFVRMHTCNSCVLYTKLLLFNVQGDAFHERIHDLSLFTIVNVLLELHKEIGGKTGLTMRHESFSNLLL
jgi:hypothetical protein